jgi:hypothetical protein
VHVLGRATARRGFYRPAMIKTRAELVNRSML